MRDAIQISVRIRDIAAERPEGDEPEYEPGDVTILASLSPAALEALQVLKPMVVVKRGREYQLVGGYATYRALRAALGVSANVSAVQLPSSQASVASALDLLVGPALEGADASDNVLRRWLGLTATSAQALAELGFKRLSRRAIADMLGVSRHRLRRVVSATDEPDKNVEEEGGDGTAR